MPDIVGTEDRDVIGGTDAADTIKGLGGDDRLYGGAGDDIFDGGEGSDVYFGGDGFDTVLFNQSFESVTFSFNGRFLLVHGRDDERLLDDVESLVFDGVSFDFESLSQIAAPFWYLYQGTWYGEWFHGGDSNEEFKTAGGDDVVTAEAGDDILHGEAGNDTLAGEAGDDTLIGGDGADVYWIRAGKWGEGSDVITDFERGADTIDFVLSEILKREPAIMALTGDAGTLELSDLEASASWIVTVSEEGSILIEHATGSVELQGIAASDQWDSFTDLTDVLTVDGTAIPVGDPSIPDSDDGPNTITGNAWAEWLKGTAEGQTLDALAGNDVLRGYGGDDTLLGGEGDDTLRGESGDDVLTGGAGSDIFAIRAGKWGEGADTITDFEIGIDTVDLNSADILNASQDIATLTGDPGIVEATDLDASEAWTVTTSADGDLLIIHPTGSIEFDGIPLTDDIDSFADLAQHLSLDGQALPSGPEFPRPVGDACEDLGPRTDVANGTFRGSEFDDCIRGTNGFDVIIGNAGDDVLRGYGGIDDIRGGDGNDTIDGGSGLNILFGDAGSDAFIFGASPDVWGQSQLHDFERGVDTVIINAADVLAGDPGITTLAGDPNKLELEDLDASSVYSVANFSVGVTLVHSGYQMILYGVPWHSRADTFVELAEHLRIVGNEEADPPTPDPDTVAGNPWNEWLKGTGEADRLDALAGDDVVRGYGGDDTLVGGTGDDTLRGEAGDDQLTGGEGADIFRIRSGKWGQGDDVITDFELGTDKIALVAADMLKDDPTLAGTDGVLGLDDLDASGNFALGASADGDLLISHQTGSVEVDGVAFDATTDSFDEIANILEIEVA